MARFDIFDTIETLRKVKYRPTGGFCAFYLADPSPAGGFGVLDSDRRAKPALQTLVDACRPVIVVGDPIPARSAVGDVHTIRIHVVSDRRDALRDGVVTATISHADGTTSVSRWGGAVDPDAFVRWTYARALAHRQPRYRAMAENWGVTVKADDVAKVRSEADLVEAIAAAMAAR